MEQVFVERYPDLVKHLVVNDMVDVSNPDISITARTKKLYDKQLFPDLNKKEIDQLLKNKRVLDIGCGYNPIYDESLISYVRNKPALNCSIKGIDIIDLECENYENSSIFTLT